MCYYACVVVNASCIKLWSCYSRRWNRIWHLLFYFKPESSKMFIYPPNTLSRYRRVITILHVDSRGRVHAAHSLPPKDLVADPRLDLEDYITTISLVPTSLLHPTIDPSVILQDPDTISCSGSSNHTFTTYALGKENSIASKHFASDTKMVSPQNCFSKYFQMEWTQNSDDFLRF